MKGNIVRGQARTFASGACGWYLGGKIQLKVGKKLVWAQMGLNLVVTGSKTWDP
eukprot:COSAG01_NODE_836_length_13206_cov_139.627375_10_plen_54_part_00